MIDPSPDPVQPTPIPPPPAPTAPPPPAPERRSSLVVVAAVAALTIAAASWLFTSREIANLRDDIQSLQENYRQLAANVMQGRAGASGPIGQLLDIANAPAQGRSDAVVTLVEFSDYECPFCIRHFQQTMPRIEENYIKNGKIRYVFRDFPIDSNHPQAIRAHEASRCGLEQEKFWDLHTRLFSAPGTHEPAALEERAKEAGLSLPAFQACLSSGRTTAAIRQIGSVAESLGATGTPWFFVGLRDLKTNKVRVVKPIGGAQPYEQFASALDAALKEAENK